jgi:hypothetical protein
MMCPDYRAIDHVGSCLAPRRVSQRLEHRIEHAGRDPSSIAPEDAAPLAIVIGKMPPLRIRPSDPHHTLEVASIILCRATTATARQERADQSPFFIRNSDPLTQYRLQKAALNQRPSPASSFVHEA